MAAVLALRMKAVLSHRSAAAQWGLLPYQASAPACVTVLLELRVTRPNIRIHRANLDRRDIRRRQGMALTSPPRTILDLAAEVTTERSRVDRLSDVEQLVAEAHYRRLATEAELRDQIDRNPHRRGIAAVRQVLDLPGGPQRTRSEPERRLLNLLRRSRITGFEANAVIHGYEVDFLWRDQGVAIEFDGYDAHSGRIAVERDRMKWASLIARGVRILHVTSSQLNYDSAGVISRLKLALAQSSEAVDAWGRAQAVEGGV